MTDSSGTKPPTRQQRQVCWKLRDEYFACLDRLNIVDPVAVEKDPEQAKDCLESKKKYEDACMASWVCLSIYLMYYTLDIQQQSRSNTLTNVEY